MPGKTAKIALVAVGLIGLGGVRTGLAGITGVATDLKDRVLPGLNIAVYDENDNVLKTSLTGPNGEIDLPTIENLPAHVDGKAVVIKLVFSGTSLGEARQTVSLQPLNGERNHAIAVIVPVATAAEKFRTPVGGYPLLPTSIPYEVGPAAIQAAPPTAAYSCPAPAPAPAPHQILVRPRRWGHGLFSPH